jgi:hypothetical protein
MRRKSITSRRGGECLPRFVEVVAGVQHPVELLPSLSREGSQPGGIDTLVAE